jgi:hypothetical protein
MQGKGDKKITVLTKTMNVKKPNLEIKVPECDSVPKSNSTAGFTNFAKDDHASSKYQSISTVTSPTHFKSVPPISEVP